MRTLSPRLPRAFCLLLMCALGATQLLPLPSSAAPAQVQSGLKFNPNPVVIGTDPVRLTIKDEAGTELKLAQGKFSADTNEYVNFNPETLELTPKKSGKTKLKITFTPAAPPPQTPTPTPTASPTASPAASPTATPVASPTASPTPAAPKSGDVEVVVKYKSVALAKTVVESGKAWEFVGGQKVAVRSSNFLGEAFEGVKRELTEVELVPADPTILKAGKVTATEGEVEALAVKGIVPTKLTPRVDGQDYAPIDVKISESVKGFTVLVDGQPFAESGDAVKVPLPEGTKKTIEVKPVGRQESVTGLAGFTITQPDPSLITVVHKEGGKYEVTANVTGSTTTDKPRMTFTAENADGTADDVSVPVEFQVIRKNAYIELLTPQSVFLMRGGRLNIEARVKNKQGNELNQTVTFSLPDPQAKSGLWVTLSQSGNRATLSWRDPTEAEVRAANSNELVRRPTQMVVKAKAGAGAEEITGEVTIYMGEVSKFTKLKVKLNQMDERTASDLYGTVMAKEYYVMSVRLFNNLKDEESQEYIGSSILAYSASIEMAVQLEKKFDGKTGSAFKNVIKGDAAKAIADKRSKAAGDLMLKQAQNDIDFARDAQAELKRVADAEREAALKAYDLLAQLEQQAKAIEDLRARAVAAGQTEEGRKFEKAAGEAAENRAKNITSYEQAVEAAVKASEVTLRMRDNIARQSYLRQPITQTLQGVSDPDTAIDDGKWHLVTRADLERIAPQPRPAEPSRGLFPRPRPLESFSLSESVSGPRSRTDAPTPEEPPDPPCAGVVTYRPFTFEMMVNTVDRRDGRSLRNKVFKVLDFVGIGTSYVTSVAVPGNSSDLPLGLEKYRNLLLPSLDQLVPNYKEQQRQNIVSQAMKEIEEIPFGSDITRVIFIPKKTIRGIIRGHETRISEICPFYFSIDVAIIQKGRETVTAGRATP